MSDAGLTSENLVVIFGAGASFDSAHDQRPASTGDISESRPPLANHLFHEAYARFIDRYRSIAPAVSRLRDAVQKRRPLEPELRKLQEEANTNPYRSTQVLGIRFYLRDLIEETTQRWLAARHGVTNYAHLVDEIQHWRRANETKRAQLSYVTFNYETLLEDALERAFGMTFPSVSRYVEQPGAAVFKPHGSINWVHLIEPDSLYNNVTEMVRQAIRIRLRNDIISNAELNMFVDRTLAPSIPAIAIPVDQKSAFEFPEQHLVALRHRLKAADKFLIIGWRGTEKHFTDELRGCIGQRRVAFHIVAANEAEAKATWQNLGITLSTPPCSLTCSARTGFSDFITSGELQVFLDQPL